MVLKIGTPLVTYSTTTSVQTSLSGDGHELATILGSAYAPFFLTEPSGLTAM